MVLLKIIFLLIAVTGLVIMAIVLKNVIMNDTQLNLFITGLILAFTGFGLLIVASQDTFKRS